MSYVRDSSEDLRYNSETGQYEPIPTTAVLTIVPTPNDATVTFSTGTVSGNTCTVAIGTSVTYTVSKTHYNTESATVTVDADMSVSVSLTETLYTYTIDSVPVDATVTLTASGYTQSGNSISVPYNTSVDWSVSKDHYTTQSGTKTVTQTETDTVELVLVNHTLTISPTPNDATVVLTAAGYSQVGNTITVPYGTSVDYSVSKDHYNTISNTVTVTSDNTISIQLTEILYTYTINPTPNDANVVLTAAGYTQSDNSITVPYNTSVSWTVYADHYITQSGTKVVTQTESDNVSLTLENYTLTIVPTPNDATVVLTAAGYSQVGNTITVPYGTTVSYSVSKEHYDTRSDTVVLTADTTLNIDLSDTLYTYTIIPVPNDATVTLTATGYLQSNNSITVPYGTNVSWEVSAPHYDTQSGSKIITQTETNTVTLDLTLYTYTIDPVPADATVTLSAQGYTQVENSISVPYNTAVAWFVSKTDYDTRSGTKTVTQTETDIVSLDLTLYTLTISPTPANATVELIAAGYTQVGNTISVPTGTVVTYTVSKDHYNTEYNSVTVTADDTIYVQLTDILYTYTINPTPVDATVVMTAAGYSQDNNSISVPYNTQVSWSVSKEHYVTQSGTKTVLQTESNNVDLSLTTHTLTINPIPADSTVTLVAAGYTQVGNSITVPYGTSVVYTAAREFFETETDTVEVLTTQTLDITLDLQPNTYPVINLHTKNLFKNKSHITFVDLHNKPWVANSMAFAFHNCTNLTTVTNIHNAVTNMYGTFEYCSSLVNAPTIPNSVSYLGGTFFGCTNLVNAPVIPNSITVLSSTFAQCSSLTDTPVIPNSVTSMSSTFANCSSLVNTTNIPDSVINMQNTFRYCTNLTGNINIISNQVTDAVNCFSNTSLTKNVYIPYYNNGIATTTYNSFTTAGYDNAGTLNGVYLKDNNPEVTLTINTTPADATVTFSGGTTSDHNCITHTGTPITYTISKEGYITSEPVTVIVNETQTINAPELVKATAILTVNTTPADATVNFSTGTVSGHTCTVLLNTQVTYTISKEGYITSEPYTITVTEDVTVNAPPLVELPYTPGEVVFESSNAGTSTFTPLIAGNYELLCVGAGGGASSSVESTTGQYQWVALASGGSGGYSKTNTTLSSAVTVTVGAYTASGNGGSSSVGNLCSATGGTAGVANYSDDAGGSAGSAGSGTTSNGQSGNATRQQLSNSGSLSAAGGSAKYGNYGAGATISDEHSRRGTTTQGVYLHHNEFTTNEGTPGYVKITYLGQ